MKTNTENEIGKSQLAEIIAKALAIADSLNCAEVGIHLNAALVALTGGGVAPPPTS